MGKKSISENKRAQAVALFDAGLKITSIARQLHISWTAVKNAIKRYREHDTFKDLSRTGRPSKITPRATRHLKRLTRGANRTNANIITQNLNDSLSTCISATTVKRHLHKMGYKYTTKIKKQYLKKIHKVKRIAWCKKFSSYTIEDWRRIIFSDESTYYVLKRKNKMMVWWTKAEELDPDCLQQISTGNGGKVGVWGAICGYGTTSALLYSDNMNSTKYCEVLNNQLIPSIKRLPKGKKYALQHDLAPWHTSNIVKEQIRKLKINILEWPPNSPDLNVVEELWSIIDKRLASKTINAKAELEKRLQEEWDKITITLCRSLVDSMPEPVAYAEIF
jgi:transposase